MKYAFFTNTPAHVHLYKNAVRRLREEGHDVLVMGRDYGCTGALIEYYSLPHIIYGECKPTASSLFKELPQHFLGIARAVKNYKPDMIFGMGSYAAFAGSLSNAATVLILDSEPTRLDHLISRPFARSILTPTAFRRDLGSKHHRFRGFKECAYLHPEEFHPDESVRASLGVDADERYGVVRFNAFGSYHDIGRRGFTMAQREALVREIADHMPVYVSTEDGRGVIDHPNVCEYDLHPGRMHDALAEASLLVADSQTMVTESALLGTPTIRSNSFVGESDMGNFVELERQDLVWNIRDFDGVMAGIRRILSDTEIERRWRTRRDRYVSNLVNLTDVIVNIARHAGRVPSETSINGILLSSG